MKNFKKTVLSGFMVSGFLIAIFASINGFAEETTIHFAIAGDRTGGHVAGIYEKIVEEIELLKPEFVMTVGDMIEGYSEDTTEVKNMWQEYQSIIKTFTMPVHFTPGNHDISNETALPLYKRFAGEPYYSFDYKNLHFIILDTSRIDKIEDFDKTQLNWLEQDLKKSKKAKSTLVFMHKPFWFDSLANGKPDILHSLFVKYGVDAVFTGHFHIYFSAKYDGILYTGIGSSGGGCDPGPTGIQYHFGWVTVKNNQISVSPVKIDAVESWDQVTASDIKCINRLVIYGLEFPAPVPMADDLSVLSNSIPLKIKNLTAQSVNDTLKWTVPENWTLEPAKTVVNVQPGDSLALNFTVSNNRKPYPLPKASLKFEYSKDKKSPVDKELPVARKITCTRAATPPVIDGILSDPCWKNPVRQFFSIDGSPMVTDSVYFYFSYDNENLYLAALCKDKKIEEMVSKITEKDGEVYTDDNVGYFIAPSRKSKETYQIIFNPLGTSFDQKVVIDAMGNFNDDINWNSTYDVKTTWAAGYWIFEGRFPVSQFKESLKPGDEFGINFRRKQPRLKNSANFQIPLSYDPESYGILLMAE